MESIYYFSLRPDREVFVQVTTLAIQVNTVINVILVKLCYVLILRIVLGISGREYYKYNTYLCTAKFIYYYNRPGQNVEQRQR